jgi:transcriptional regulator GlxA family with amidase domain
MRIAVLGSEGCLASGFVGLVDILSLAQRAIADSQGGEIPFEIITASTDGRPVRDGHGRRLEVDLALRSVTAADFAVVDTAPSTQAVYIPAGHLAASNPFLVDAEHFVRQPSETPLTARDLARRLATSERTLHRRDRRISQTVH